MKVQQMEKEAACLLLFVKYLEEFLLIPFFL
jgi:hypothetical protein